MNPRPDGVNYFQPVLDPQGAIRRKLPEQIDTTCPVDHESVIVICATGHRSGIVPGDACRRDHCEPGTHGRPACRAVALSRALPSLLLPAKRRISRAV